MIEPRVSGLQDRIPGLKGDNSFLREIWSGGECGKERVFISGGGHSRETALRTAEDKGGFTSVYPKREPNSIPTRVLVLLE